MKQFRYKLNAVLKLREFEKKKVENQLGLINQEIAKIISEIETHHEGIQRAHEQINQFEHTKKISMGMIKSFPEYLSATTKEVERLSLILSEKKNIREDILKALGEISGKVKILEEDEKKKRKDHYKKEQKKVESNIEEMRIILRGA